MSLHVCQAGTTTGFPITLSQSIYKDWAGVSGNTEEQIQQLVVPTDFTVQWGHSISADISSSDALHISDQRLQHGQ